MKISVIVPAHNEEALIGRCLDSIDAAAREYGGEVETIVVANRCTDRTVDVVHSRGAASVPDDSRSIAAVRNAGVRRATGDAVVTIDADSMMSPNMLVEVERRLRSGKYIGGGVLIKPERISLGIIATGLVVGALVLWSRAFGGLFWCLRKDFEAVGGFDESILSAEDVDFARRLRAYGRARGKRAGTIWNAHIVTSCRKGDRFGDWYLLRHPGYIWRLWRGRDREAADKFYYDFNG